MTDSTQYEQSLVALRGATDHASSKSHIELMNTFNPLLPHDAATSASDDYAKIATGWEESVKTFAARIRRSSESAWDGTAATAARQAISEYATDALNFTPALKLLSTRVGDAISAVDNTKKNITPYSDDPQSWANPGDWFDGNPEKDAEESARQVVQDQYVTPIAEADKFVPVLPKPKDPVKASEVPNPVDTGNGNDTGNGTGSPNTNPQGTNPEGTNPQGTNPEGTTPEGTTPEGTEDPAKTDDPSTSPQSTNPEGTNPQSTAPQPTTPSPGTPSGTPSPGTPSLGTPSLGTTPSPGKTVPGGPSSTATIAGTGKPSGTSTQGRNGMPGMGGMPGGRGGQGDEDDEHSTPDYLIYDRGTELLGSQPPALPPGGVIGG